jgi:hypothetical protein
VYVGNQSAATILNIPLSWNPFNLTEQAPRAAILGSQHFLRAVSSGVLTLMDPSEARDILATPAGMREAERVNQLKAKVEMAVRNPNSDEFKLTLEGEEGKEAETKHSVSANFFDQDTISTTFKAWVAKNNTLQVEDAINAARVRAEFTVDEMQYIMDNTVHARIRKGFKRRLEETASHGAGE